MRIFIFIFCVLTFVACNTERHVQRYASLLPGKWELNKVNGKEVEVGDGTKPYIEFKPNEKFLVGHGGCNKISGIFTIDGPKLVMNDIVSEKASCPQLEFENRVINFISLKSLTFNMKSDDELVIHGSGGEKIELKRAK